MQKYQDKVKAILEALPYIKKFHGSVVVIKYGGSSMLDNNMKKIVARDITLLNYIGMKPVIIHGGGKDINKWLDKIGKKPEFSPEGLRVTDLETMEVVEMVLGRLSKEIVKLINFDGETKAVSLSGKDGGVIQAKKLESKYEHGYVGDVVGVNIKLIETLLNAGNIPVISSVGLGTDGETYNINADDAACAIAAALKATKLIMLTDVDGVLDKEGKLIQKIYRQKADEMIAQGVITGGMIPKIKGVFAALEQGVKSVHILNGTIEHSILLEILTDQGIGTMITESEVQQ